MWPAVRQACRVPAYPTAAITSSTTRLLLRSRRRSALLGRARRRTAGALLGRRLVDAAERVSQSLAGREADAPGERTEPALLWPAKDFSIHSSVDSEPIY